MPSDEPRHHKHTVYDPQPVQLAEGCGGLFETESLLAKDQES